MKKITLIVLSLLVIVAMVMSFTACKTEDDSNNDETKKSQSTEKEKDPTETKEPESSDAEETDKLTTEGNPLVQPKEDYEEFVGEWITEIDISKIVNDQISQNDATMASYIKFDSLVIYLKYTFKADKTYKIEADKSAFDSTYDGMVKTLSTGLKKYLEDMAKSQGLDMTAEQILSASGQTMESLVAASFGKEMFIPMLEQFDLEGNFDVKNGKLYSSTVAGQTPVADIEYIFVSDDEMKLDILDKTQDEIGIFPMVLKKK